MTTRHPPARTISCPFSCAGGRKWAKLVPKSSSWGCFAMITPLSPHQHMISNSPHDQKKNLPGGVHCHQASHCQKKQNEVSVPLPQQTGEKGIVGTNNLTTTGHHTAEWLAMHSVTLIEGSENLLSTCVQLRVHCFDHLRQGKLG